MKANYLKLILLVLFAITLLQCKKLDKSLFDENNNNNIIQSKKFNRFTDYELSKIFFFNKKPIVRNYNSSGEEFGYKIDTLKYLINRKDTYTVFAYSSFRDVSYYNIDGTIHYGSYGKVVWDFQNNFGISYLKKEIYKDIDGKFSESTLSNLNENSFENSHIENNFLTFTNYPLKGINRSYEKDTIYIDHFYNQNYYYYMVNNFGIILLTHIKLFNDSLQLVD